MKSHLLAIYQIAESQQSKTTNELNFYSRRRRSMHRLIPLDVSSKWSIEREIRNKWITLDRKVLSKLINGNHAASLI
jgi:hypothetical protein